MLPLRYFILVCIAISLAHAADEVRTKPESSSSLPPKKAASLFFPHRHDLPHSFSADPTFKSFRVLERSKPRNPSGVRGRYELSIAFIIEVDGGVREAKITKSSGSDILDTTYLEMIKKWKFAPAEMGGKPIPMQVVQPFKVEL